jgi:hypothetical protein
MAYKLKVPTAHRTRREIHRKDNRSTINTPMNDLRDDDLQRCCFTFGRLIYTSTEYTFYHILIFYEAISSYGQHHNNQYYMKVCMEYCKQIPKERLKERYELQRSPSESEKYKKRNLPARQSRRSIDSSCPTRRPNRLGGKIGTIKSDKLIG